MKQRNRKATVVDFEGIDGAGKATQVEMTRARLESEGKKVAVFSFPRYKKTVGGRLLDVAIQSEEAESYKFATLDPYASAFLHFADYAESSPEIKLALMECDYVLFDRYVNSTLFHHGGKFTSEMERERFINHFYRLAHFQLDYPKPDTVLYFDIPLELALERVRARAEEQKRAPDSVERNLKYIADSHRAGLELGRKWCWKVIPLVEAGVALPRETVFAQVIRQLSLSAPVGV